MSEASELLDMASVALDEAIEQLGEVRHQLRLAKLGIWELKEILSEVEEIENGFE